MVVPLSLKYGKKPISYFGVLFRGVLCQPGKEVPRIGLAIREFARVFGQEPEVEAVPVLTQSSQTLFLIIYQGFFRIESDVSRTLVSAIERFVPDHLAFQWIIFFLDLIIFGVSQIAESQFIG
jgi:hypothetical protein